MNEEKKENVNVYKCCIIIYPVDYTKIATKV